MFLYFQVIYIFCVFVDMGKEKTYKPCDDIRVSSVYKYMVCVLWNKLQYFISIFRVLSETVLEKKNMKKCWRIMKHKGCVTQCVHPSPQSQC